MPRPSKIWWWKAKGIYAVNHNGKRYRLGKDYDTAKRKFGEILAQKPEAPQLTEQHLAVILDQFISWTKAHRPDSLRWYTDYMQSFLNDYPNLLVSELKPHHVETWSSKGGGKRGKITAMKRALNWAVEMGHIDHSPIAKMKRPQTKRREAVTPAEFEQLLSHVDDDAFRDLLIVSWECGVRPQEVKLVEACHVDLEHHRWQLPKELVKGKRRQRLVYMTERAEQIVARHVADFPSGPLFRNTRGTPWTASAVKCRFARLEKKVGKRFCQYMLRHGWITNRIVEGKDSHVVALLAGHSSTRMIDEFYSHADEHHDFLLSQVRSSDSSAQDGVSAS